MTRDEIKAAAFILGADTVVPVYRPYEQHTSIHNLKQDIKMISLFATQHKACDPPPLCYDPLIKHMYKTILNQTVKKDKCYKYAAAYYWLMTDFNNWGITGIKYALYKYPEYDIDPDVYKELADLLIGDDHPGVEARLSALEKLRKKVKNAIDKFSRI